MFDLVSEEKYRVRSRLTTFDVFTLIFVLSAIRPKDHVRVLQRARTLGPKGLLCFRDYGLYAMTGFDPRNIKLSRSRIRKVHLVSFAELTDATILLFLGLRTFCVQKCRMGLRSYGLQSRREQKSAYWSRVASCVCDCCVSCTNVNDFSWLNIYYIDLI